MRTTLLALGGLCLAVLFVGIATAGDEEPNDRAETVPQVGRGEERPEVPPADPEPAEPSRQPNVIVVTTDDQTVGQFRRRFMPHTFRALVDRGTRFTDSIVTTPLCCPSRASLLTGQYGHNNGILNNNPGYGDLIDKESTLPSWLQHAGYRTAHVGKFLNRFKETLADPAETPPGWDRWITLLRSKEYYSYNLAIDGRIEHFGVRDEHYLTRVLNDAAADTIRRLGRARGPFYLQLDQFAPHSGSDGGIERGERCARLAVPDPRDDRRWADQKLPRPPSFNRAQTAAGEGISEDGRFSAKGIALLGRSYRCALESLAAVDRGMARIDRVLRQTGQAKNTVIVFTSDNGELRGEHRVLNKLLPYEEALRVPLAMRIPSRYLDGRDPVSRVGKPVANIDLAPTILELAGARPCVGGGECRTIDGRPLVGLVSGDNRGFPTHRALGVEFDGGARIYKVRPCAYHGVRVRGEVYVRYPSVSDPDDGGCKASGAAQHFDLRSDPDQINDLEPSPRGAAVAARQSELARLAARLQDCAGIKGRDQRQGDRPFCG